MIEPTKPVLSVVVTMITDTVRAPGDAQLRQCLQSLADQWEPPTMEVIVPHAPNFQPGAALRREYPQVRFVEYTDLKRFAGQLGSRDHHNELRARGIAAAMGSIVALTDDCSLADPHWCAQIVKILAGSAAGVGGAIERGAGGTLRSAVYFCDFGRYQRPLREGETLIASDANVAYKRSALQSVSRVWRDGFEEITVHPALRAMGEQVVLSSKVVVYENRPDFDFRTVCRERFIYGRAYGRLRNPRGSRRWIWAALCPALPGLILARLTVRAFRKRRGFVAFLKALPATAIVATAWCLGEMSAYIKGEHMASHPTERRADLSRLPIGEYSVSVVLAVLDDGVAEIGSGSIIGVLEALRTQTVRPFEVIVPLSDSALIGEIRRVYPDVTFVRFDPDSPPRSMERLEELRAAGVVATKGEIVALLEDHVRPDPGWIAAIQKVHQGEFAAVGGAVENGIDRVLNWATYFADLGRYHNPLPAGESSYASLVNVSYKKSGLNLIRHIWSHRFHEAEVHGALMALGERLALSPKPVVRQYRPKVRFVSSLREFFIWGRSYGAARAKPAGAGKRIFYACLTPLVPAILLLRSGVDTARKGRLVRAWITSLPIGVALTTAWAAGELAGYLAGARNSNQDRTSLKPAQSVNRPAPAASQRALHSHNLAAHPDSSTKGK